MNLLVEFFRHNATMNRRLVEACRPLAAEQLAASVVGTYGSIGASLVHIANAQVGYAGRLLSLEAPERLSEDPFPGFEQLGDRFALADAQLLDAATNPDLGRQVEVTDDDPPGVWRMPVALFLVQAINHGTEHRSQIATTLTHLGFEPPEMDGWAYFEASGQLVVV